MNIIFVGKQGSGKGTEAKIIAEKLGLEHISTGDLFRNVTGELKKEVDNLINKGNLVPDKLTLEILQEKLKEVKKGTILDGFPRNLRQAEMLDKIMKIDRVIEIDIPDELARKRLQGRWNCKKCQIAYNYVTEPKPKVIGICDKCKEKLFQREDDSSLEAVNKRLETYYKETTPILEHYKKIVVKVDGSGIINEVAKKIIEVLS